MRSIPKYSWLTYQKNPKRIKSIMSKLQDRKSCILGVISTIKKNNLPISDEFIKQQLNHSLLTQYRWNLFCACYRNIMGFAKLISEEKYNGYTFEKFVNEEGKYYTKEFYRYLNINPP